VLDLSNFSWDRIEAPIEVGCREGSREIFFDLKMVNFGVFCRDKFALAANDFYSNLFKVHLE